MSTNKIELQFTRTLDLDLVNKGIKVWLVRITGQIKFQTKNGWSRPYEAIIDTGAPVSLIPYSIWTKIKTEIIADYRISGVVPDKKCSLPVKVGNVLIVF